MKVTKWRNLVTLLANLLAHFLCSSQFIICCFNPRSWLHVFFVTEALWTEPSGSVLQFASSSTSIVSSLVSYTSVFCIEFEFLENINEKIHVIQIRLSRHLRLLNFFDGRTKVWFLAKTNLIILKFHEPLQRYLLTCKANSALLGRSFCTGQQQLWRG